MQAMKKKMEAKLKKEQKPDEAKDEVNDVARAMAECSLQNDQNREDTASSAGAKKKESSEAANMLTFSRQKLALMQSEYDPKCCNHCGKPAIEALSGNLMTCQNCKTAKYCSRDCQTEHWKQKHKIQCKEIVRLKATTEVEEANGVQLRVQGGGPVQATMDGRPWLIDRDIQYYNMCVHEGKLFPMAFNERTKERVISMYDASTGMNEGVVCRPSGDVLVGVCAVNVGDLHYLVVVHAPMAFQTWRMDFYSYPQLKRDPVYTFKARPDTVGAIHFADGNLLVINPQKHLVEEFDVSSFPVRRTGLRIPSGLSTERHRIRNMCAMKQGGEKRLLLEYDANLDIGPGADSALRCVDYRGQKLWEVKQQLLGGLRFHPEGVCTDNNGHVFTLNCRGNRVVVINPDRSIQVIITTPGIVTALARCNVTGKLYVAHRNEGSVCQAMVSRYNIAQE